MYENDKTDQWVKDILIDHYKGLPTAFNLPLEIRVRPELRGAGIQKRADKERAVSSKGPMVVPGMTQSTITS